MKNNKHNVLVDQWDRIYPTITHGERIYIYDDNGRKYIDAIGGIHVVSIGHGVVEIADAVHKQMSKIAFVDRRQFLNEPVKELAQVVTDMSPGLTHAYFVSGGSEANEMAVQIAYQYHIERGKQNKYKVIGRWHSYHGFTALTESMGGHLSHRRKLSPYLLNFPHIQPSHCYHCPFNLEFPSCNIACAAELERVIEQEGPETIAAFIAEPIVGSTGGAIVPPPGYYQMIRNICDKFDILFIADEVVTGFGRTGKNFGIDHWGVSPDILTSAKGLSSGYAPIGVVMVRPHIVDTLQSGKKGNFALRLTFSGNPICCSVALAVQKYIKEHNLIENCIKSGDYLKSQLEHLAEDCHIIGNVRGIGLLLAVEFVQNRSTRTPFPRTVKLHETIVSESLKRGLLLVGGQGTGLSIDGDHVLITPPFIITKEECNSIIEILKDAILSTQKILKK